MEESSLAYFYALMTALVVAAAIAGIILVVGFRALSRQYAAKIGQITDGMARLAKGDRHFEIDGIERKDEVGEMLRAIALFKKANIRLEQWAAERAERANVELAQQERAQAEQRRALGELANQLERTVGDVVSGVAAASSQLRGTAGTMAGAAEEATTRTGQVVQSMAEANAGANAAAAASDEFAVSIGEISRQAASSAELARAASGTASEADATISALSSAAEEIGQIVDMIQSIARRTNLLALNASIEAARGGEAGRGFAVVASEVKELAAQTSQATEKVAGKIEAIQQSTGASVTALRRIAGQIGELESTAISIASAVDQQSVAGQDLARSIDMAARATNAVSTHVEDVRELSLSTGAAASQVLSSSTELEQQAEELRSEVEAFLARVRAG
jgi:methyl-accepting chemotaxis protein